jgi:hypothetical protein
VSKSVKPSRLEIAGSRLKKLLPWLRRGLEVALFVTGGVLLAIGGSIDSTTTILGRTVHKDLIVFVIGGACLFADAVLVVRGRALLHRLQAERPGLESRAALGEVTPIRMIRLELRELCEKAGLYSEGRVSLYRFDADRFTLIGRYSARPAFDQDLGRYSLPLDQGVIGRAWKDSAAEQTDLPSAGTDGAPPTQQWLRAQERTGVPEATARAFKMRSQAYVAVRIATKGGESQGAIVFESTVSRAEVEGADTKPNLTRAGLEPIVKEASNRLAKLLEESKVLEPDRVREILAAEQVPTPHGSD